MFSNHFCNADFESLLTPGIPNETCQFAPELLDRVAEVVIMAMYSCTPAMCRTVTSSALVRIDVFPMTCRWHPPMR